MAIKYVLGDQLEMRKELKYEIKVFTNVKPETLSYNANYEVEGEVYVKDLSIECLSETNIYSKTLKPIRIMV